MDMCQSMMQMMMDRLPESVSEGTSHDSISPRGAHPDRRFQARDGSWAFWFSQAQSIYILFTEHQAHYLAALPLWSFSRHASSPMC